MSDLPPSGKWDKMLTWCLSMMQSLKNWQNKPSSFAESHREEWCLELETSLAGTQLPPIHAGVEIFYICSRPICLFALWVTKRSSHFALPPGRLSVKPSSSGLLQCMWLCWSATRLRPLWLLATRIVFPQLTFFLYSILFFSPVALPPFRFFFWSCFFVSSGAF